MNGLKTGNLSVISVFALTATLLLSAAPTFVAQALVPAALAGVIYTCTDANDLKTFSDRPCKSHGKDAGQKSTPIPDTTRPASNHSGSTQRTRKSGGHYGNYINRARAVGDQSQRP